MRYKRASWVSFVAAVVFWGVGDTSTTIALMLDPALVETNPFLRSVGIPGLLVAKAAVVGLLVGVERLAARLPRPYDVLGLSFSSPLAVLGLYATVNNLFLWV